MSKQPFFFGLVKKPIDTKTVEFSKTNYTLKLKNVQETDSGDYTAVVLETEKKKVAEYKVIVQAPVSPVNLTVGLLSNSSDSCNLTVTCRTQDSHISTTFTCLDQTCSEDGDRSKATTSGAVLHVYLENDSIKCNHSNQVSRTTSQEARIQDFCHQQPSLNSAAGIVFGSVAGVVVATAAVVGFILCKKNKDKKKSNGNTVYDNPQDINSAQTQTQDPVTSTYALVQFPQRSEHPTDTVNTSSPETIYAQVMKREKPNSPSLESPTPDLYST
ncbi:uncharacterized protein LOC114844759 [Betta splendens]|uniref:Uncharacterized protein LOC114844759 n=1 Tax=Betta splendens TaxID=158456 RepID=A0A9W2XE03_BETSP|nr:uncharacterized protein LOC114844759 [Betta splendens]